MDVADIVTKDTASSRDLSREDPQVLKHYYHQMLLHPPLRGADRRDVHQGQDRRLLPPQPRRRGHHRRPDGGADAGRLHLHQLSRARLHPRPRRRRRTGDGRAVRQRDRRLARPRRLDAPVRRQDALHGRLRASSAGSCRWRPARPTRSNTKGKPGVVVCQMGDATTNIGAWHESLNLAKLYGSCRSSSSSSTTASAWAPPSTKARPSRSCTRRGCVPHARRARRRQRRAGGARRDAPAARARGEGAASRRSWTSVSFRFRGHSVIDPDRYRDPGRGQAGPRAARSGRRSSPGSCSTAKIVDDEWLKETAEQVEHEVQEAIDFAEQSRAAEDRGPVRATCTRRRCRTRSAKRSRPSSTRRWRL